MNIYNIVRRNFFKIVLLCGVLGFTYSMQAQEFLTGIGVNKQIAKESQQQQKKRTDNEPLFLPFFEDFSNYTGYPNATLFVDRQAFVNNSFPVRPPTIGVATLDALNEFGRIYSHLNEVSKGADTLTSCFIRLDSLLDKDTLTYIDPKKANLFFSFYFQPGGAGLLGSGAGERIGSQPNKSDSLVLEFGYLRVDSVGTVWNHVWSTPGFSVDKWISDTLTPHQYFKQVLIPITDTNYFCKKFQFRFRNYASLEPQQGIKGWEGNVDQWHIDYIRLDTGRNNIDFFTNDLGFVSPTTSFLKNYQSMPWKQFQPSDMKTNFTNELTNLNDGKRTPRYKYSITQGGTLVSEYTDMWAGAQDIESYFTHGLYENPPVTSPPISFTPTNNTGTDTTSFVITHVFTNNSGDDFCTANDTCIFKQKFYDYFAYDDGTAEYGYCLNNQYNMAYLAMNFQLRVSDSLSAVRMWFNRTKNDENKQARFSFVVWKDDNGKPGAVLYRTDEYHPDFADSLHYLYFKEYRFEKKYFVSEANKNIWIGFEQKGNVQLNIGFDQNISQELYEQNLDIDKAIFKYNTNGNWTNSSFRGVPMIRPVFGEPLNLKIPSSPKLSTIKIYPNPTTGELNIQSSTFKVQSVDIYDIIGKKQKSRKAEEQNVTLNIYDLPSGIYFIRVQTDKGIVTEKIIKY